MRKLKKTNKLKRNRRQRRALLISLASGLVLHGRIITTESKAKALRSFIEKMITLSKKQNLSAYRRILEWLPRNSAHKLFYEISPKFVSRAGGYTRIIKISSKKMDSLKMKIIEFTS